MFAASQIYTMLKNHKGRITVKIDSLAASAASVVAMAGDETLIAPTALMMIHDPSTCAMGNKADMEKELGSALSEEQASRVLAGMTDLKERAKNLNELAMVFNRLSGRSVAAGSSGLLTASISSTRSSG